MNQMNFREPKRKKRTPQEVQRPFPIPLNKNDDWVVYTAHLSASGTCIVHPEEIAAIYFMGYFGKGSLSRGFPCFGKRRFGAPPLIRERQWKRRKQWLVDVKKLETEPFLFSTGSANDTEETGDSNDPTESNVTDIIAEPTSNQKKEQTKSEPSGDPKVSKVPEPNKTMDENEAIQIKAVVSIPDENNEAKASKAAEEPTRTGAAGKSSKAGEKNQNKSHDLCDDDDIDEVVLDSTEEEEICEIVDNDESQSQGDDICVLNDEIDDPGDNYLEMMDDLSQEKPEENPNEMLVLPDSDSDTDNYLKNVKPRIETEGFPVTETLQLTFEETFFLMYGLGCLQVVNYDGNFFSIIEAWNYFNQQDANFISRYIVYHYFRSKGWVVKPGLKCSADFVLYKKGPPFYHASYIVVIEVADADTLIRDDAKTARDFSWNNVHGLNRLSAVLSKELLVAQVLWPSTVARSSRPVPLEALSEFTVRELLVRRWNPNENCEDPENEDDESEDEDSS